MSDEQQRQAEIRAKCFHPTGQWEEFKPEDLNQSIVSRFEQMVARYPDRLALKCGDEMLSRLFAITDHRDSCTQLVVYRQSHSVSLSLS